MKVYLVQAGYDYEGFDVLEVFDSRNKAEKYINDNITTDWNKRDNKECYDFCEIEEFEVK